MKISYIPLSGHRAQLLDQHEALEHRPLEQVALSEGPGKPATMAGLCQDLQNKRSKKDERSSGLLSRDGTFRLHNRHLYRWQTGHLKMDPVQELQADGYGE